MYPNPKRAKKLYAEVVPKTVDEYLTSIEKYSTQKEKDQILNPVWHVHNGKPPAEKIVMPFSMLLNSKTTVFSAKSWGTPKESGSPKVNAPDPALTSNESA